MPSLLLIQWGIVSFFVLIHFLIGFKRGTSKSGYYTVVSILMTIFTLWLVSLITIRWFISPEGLLNIVQNATGNGLPADLEQLFLDPNLSGFVFSIIDLVLRLLAFFLIYPLMKWVLTFAIFRTVWKRVVLKELLKRQNENISRNIEQQTSPRPVKTRKRLQLNATSRLLGGAFGAVRGFIVAFVFLLPLLVVASFTAGLSGNSEPLAAEHNDIQLSIVELQDDEVIPGEFQELIDYFNQLNRGPLGSLARATNIDRLLFDMVFTTRIVTPDLPTASINFGEEFEAIFGIVSVLIEGGYLQSDFDVESISADNLDDFEQIFDYLGRSNLIAWVIPIAIKYVVENVLPEQMDGIDLYDRPASAAALEAFGDIVWSEEFNQLYNVIEAVLEFASVAELMMYADNPELLAELSPQEGEALADIFRALGQLKSLTLVNIAVDYATTLEDLHEMLAWMTPEEAEAYLQDRLDFILADVEYFVGDEGVLADIANLVEFFFDDTYDVDLSVLFDLEDNPEALLDEAFAEWIGALIDELIDIQLIMELIPMGVDIAIFNAFGEDAEYTFAEDLIDAFEDVEWDQEFTNIGDIYKEIVKLGLGVLFEDDADLYAFIDELAVDHMPTLRVIVQKIFEDSQIINKTFEVAAPAVIDLAFEDDEELRDLLLTILMEDDELAINLGQEVNTILDIVETLYTFTTISELMDMMEMDTEDQLAFIDDLLTEHMPELRAIIEQVFEDSQLVSRAINLATAQVLAMVFEEEDDLYDLLVTVLIEDDELAIDIVAEFNTILDIVETLYTFTTLSELLSVMDEDTEAQLAFVDDVMTDNMAAVRTIIGQIFEDSQIVSRSLDLAIIEVLNLVIDEEDDLYDLLVTVLIEDDELAIDIVAEFNTILDIVDTLYTFTTLSELLSVMDDDTEAQLAFVDDVMTDNMAALRTIIGQIFEDSQIVSRSLDLAITEVLNLVIDEEDRFYDFIEAILIEDDELAIDIALEFNNILDIVESLYAFTTLSELIDVGDFETQELVEFIGRFGAIDETEFDQLHDAVLSLQILARMGATELQFIKDEMEIDMLYVPTTIDLGADLSTILGLVYHTASYVNDALVVTPDYEDIDLAPLLADLEFRAYLMSTEADKHSDLLLANIANLIQTMSEEEEGLGQFLFLPDVLADADPESELWVDEINALLEAVFDLAAYFVDSPYLTLSLNGINALTDDIGAVQLGLVTQFADMNEVEAAFGGFDASLIFRSSVPAVINELEIELVEGFVLTTPALVVEDDMLRVGALGDTIQAVANFLHELNSTLGFVTVSDLTDNEDMLLFLEAYNEVSVAAINTLVGADLLRGIISDALLSPDVQAFVRETVNAGVEGLTVSSDFFAFERSNGLTTQDLAELLIAIHALQITRDLIEAPDMHVFAYLATFDDARLNTVFDARMLREIITFVITDTGVMDFVAGMVEEQLDAALADIEMLQDMDLGDLLDVMPILEYVASIRGDDRLFDVVEIKNLIKTVNTLGLTTLYDLNNFQDIEYIHQVIADTQFIEQLFASERIHRSLSYTLINPETHEILADLISTVLEDLLGVPHAFDPELFNLNQPKYDLFYFSTHDGWLIRVPDIKQLLLSATRVDWLAIPIGEQETTLDLVFTLVDYFMTEDRFGVSHIDYILNSRIIMAVIDKAINLETDDYGLRSYYVSIINNMLPDFGIDLLDGVTFTDDLLAMRGISDEQGVLKASEIIAILETVQLVGLKVDFNNITLDTALGFLDADDNENDVEDYEDLFQSTILLSLITNVLGEPAVIDILRGFAEPLIDELLVSDPLFNGLVIDLDPILLIPSMIVDEDGNFDYMDIRGVLVTLNRLGVGGFDNILEDLMNIPLDALYVLVEIEEDGVNGLRFLADTKTVRLIFDAVLKQEGAIEWGLGLAGVNLGVDLTGLNLTFATQFDDETGALSADHFYELLLAIATVDVNEILSGVFRLEFIYDFLDEPFTYVPGDRLSIIYGSDIVVYLLSTVIEYEGIQQFGVDMINSILEELVAGLSPDLTVRALTAGELGITFELFNEQAFRSLITAIQATGIENIHQALELTTISAIVDQLNLKNNRFIVLDLLNAPLIKHVISTVLLNDLWSDVAAQYVNLIGADFGLEIDAELLEIDPALVGEDGYLNMTHILELIVVAYVILTVDNEFTPETLRKLEDNLRFVGVLQPRIDHILDSTILHSYIYRILTDQGVKEIAAELLTAQLEALGLELDINADRFNIPMVIFENNQIKRSEVYAFLGAFNELNLDSFDDFTNFMDIDYVYDVIDNTLVIEKLFSSLWVHVSVSKFFTDLAALNEIAEIASAYLKLYTGIDHTITFEDLDFTEAKYGLFYDDAETEEMLLHVSEIKQFLLAGTRINWLDLEISGDLSAVTDILDLFLDKGADNVRNIDFMFESKMLVAVFDKLLNMETDPIGLKLVYTELLNTYLPQLGIDLLDGVVLSDNVLTMRGVVDANGVLKASDVIAIFDTLALLDIAGGFTVEKAFMYFGRDVNDNGVEDYQDLFASNMLLSILTNVLFEEDLLDLVAGLVEDIIDDLIASDSMFDGLEVDVEPLVRIPQQIIDANGQFDYMDVRRILTVLEALGVDDYQTSESAVQTMVSFLIELNAIPLAALTILANDQIAGVNGLQYVVQTKTVHAIVDAIFKQTAAIEWGLAFASDLTELDLTTVELDLATQFDDETGMLAVDHLYELLLALAAVNADDIASGIIRLGTLYELLDEPFSVIPGDRLFHIYNSDILTHILREVIESAGVQDFVVDLANENLEAVIQGLDSRLTVRALTREDLGLTFALVDEPAMRELILAVQGTGLVTIPEILGLTNLDLIAEQLRLVTTASKIMPLLEAPLVHHVISTVLLLDIIPDVGAQYINLLAADFGIEIESDLLVLSDKLLDEEGMVAVEHIFDALVAAYAAITTGTAFSPEYLRNLEGMTTIAGITQQRIDFILASDFLMTYVDRLILDQGVKEIAADLLSEQLRAQGLDVTINPELLNVPMAALEEDGRLKTSEVKAILAAFNELNLGSFNEFNNFGNIDYIYSKVNNTTFIEKLFVSKWIHVSLSRIFTDENVLTALADGASTALRQQLGIEHDFEAEDFDFTFEQYGLFVYDEELDELLIKPIEVKHFVVAATRINWLTVSLGTGPGIVNNVADLLLDTGTDGMRNIDFMLESNMLLAILDKVLNFEYSTLGLADVAIEFANGLFEGIALLEGLVLTPDILYYDSRALDENNMLTATEIVKLIEAASLPNLRQTIYVGTFYDLVVSGDFTRLFDSYILYSLISNVLTDENVRTFGIAMANDMQSLAVIPESFLEFDPLLMDGDLIKVEEFENLVIALHSLGFTSQAAVDSINLNTFTGLVGRNIDGGKDDLDRVLDSGIIYTLLDKILKFEGLGEFVAGILADALDRDIIYVDLTPPAIMLGGPSLDAIEVGRVTKEEFRNIIVALDLLDLQALISGAEFGVDLITDLVDYNDPSDDFTTVLASDYIYLLLARVFEDEATSNAFGGFLSNAFGEDVEVDLSTPEDAKGTTGIEAGYITRVELRKLMISVKLLGITGLPDENSINITTIMDMIGRNDLDPLMDDFEIFLDSLYLQAKLSLVLLSDGIIELISSEGTLFDPADFWLPANAYYFTQTDRMIKQELYNLFAGLKVLGIDDFEEFDLGVDTVTSLNEADIDTILDSAYLYTILDLVIKKQIDLPAGVFETTGYYFGMIKKTEIKEVFKALDILAIDNLDNVDANSITIQQLRDVLDDTDSIIVRYLISQAIIEFVGEDSIPLEAYANNDAAAGILSDDELEAMVDALSALADDDSDSIGSIDFETITVAKVTGLKGTASYIIKQLVSDEIVKVIGEDNIPDDAFVLGTTRLTDAEFDAMIDAIAILGAPAELVSAISTSVDVGQVKALNLLPSTIIKQLISDAIVEVIGADNIPLDAYIDGVATNRLTDNEINEMILAIDILAGGDDTLDVQTQISTEVTVGQTRSLHEDVDSIIIKQLISDAIITTLGVDNIPADAFAILNTYDFGATNQTGYVAGTRTFTNADGSVVTINKDRAQINTHTINAPYLNGTPALILSPISTGLIAFAEFDLTLTAGLKRIEFEFSPWSTTAFNNIDGEVNVTGGVFSLQYYDEVTSTWITVETTQGQANLLTLVVNEYVTVVFNVEGPGLYRILYSYDTSTSTSNTSHALVVDNMKIITQLTQTEVGAMLDALDILANNNPNFVVGDIDTDLINIGQLKALNLLTSLVIDKLISDAIIQAVGVDNVPLDAYIDEDNTKNLTTVEITAMINVIEILAGKVLPGDDVDHVGVTSVSTTVTVGQTQLLKTSTSAIFQQLITNAIEAFIDPLDEGDKIPVDAYDATTGRLTSTEIEEMIDAIYILANGDDTLNVEAIGTDVTVGQVKALNALDSYIIDKLISDSIITMLTAARIPLTAYVGGVDTNNLLPSEITKMITALEILATPFVILPGDEDDVLVSAITFDETLFDVATLKSFPNDSIILNRMISTAIIENLDVNTIPLDSFVDDTEKTDIKRSEIDYLLDALEILGIGPDGAGSVATNVITFTKLDQIVALGNTEPEGFSPIIVHILSVPLTAAVSDVRVDGHDYGIPTIAYRNDYDLKHDEIAKLVEALKVLGNVPTNDPDTTTIADAVTGLNPTTFGPVLLGNLLDTESLIIYRMISIGINDSGVATEDAYVLFGEDTELNYDEGLPWATTPLVYDVKISEMQDLVTGMTLLGILTVDDVDAINLATVLGLSDAQIDELLDNDSTIIYYIINDIVKASVFNDPLIIPDSDFEDNDRDNRIKRASLIAFLKESN